MAATETVNQILAPEDTRLLEGIARQERQALSRLYDRYATILYTTAARILQNTEEPADVLQNVFVQIWNQAADYDSRMGTPFRWLLARR